MVIVLVLSARRLITTVHRIHAVLHNYNNFNRTVNDDGQHESLRLYAQNDSWGPNTFHILANGIIWLVHVWGCMVCVCSACISYDSRTTSWPSLRTHTHAILCVLENDLGQFGQFPRCDNKILKKMNAKKWKPENWIRIFFLLLLLSRNG